jgi:predicted phosphoribosyltransferase
LDIVLVRKLGAPYSEEFAVGAIDDLGWVHIAPHAEAAGADQAYLDREIARQRALLAERQTRYRRGAGTVDLKGRVAIVLDDGLATGATMTAALHSTRARQPAHLICAVPVASADGLRAVSAAADETVCLATPSHFGSVGQYYRDFRQVDDDEVISVLKAAPERAPPR